ncbi:hypothetical protein [Pelosinus propionicus]|uniref:Uncharacterized protein n=1 Tax=Pelosinus propionicus DSM 13327 TaxID=1123291 RepID=A0A1I4P208_9FIRM|nr:hypothetical protein [Pelosinus propionicus]SFM21874.1 hypothetical protein SAMN04490355_105630 [Pelosinus propionicus DSM 13327]
MNYMRELNAFRDWTMINRPSTGVIALWYMLMSINNMIGWKEWFTAPNQTVQLLTGLSRQGVESTRNSLIQYGLIEYKKGKSNQAGSYRMISLLEEKKQEVPVDNFSECQNLGTVLGTPVGIDVGTVVGIPLGTGVGTPVAHSYTRLDVDKTINININNSAREAMVVDNSKIDSVCPKCNGQGWYLTQVPFNNGINTRDEAVTCDCKKKPASWAMEAIK